MRSRGWRNPIPDPWVDPLIAAGSLTALVVENLSLSHHRGPLVLNLLAIALMTVPAIWRRRSPVLYTVAVLAGATALVAGLSSDGTNLAPIYVLTVPPYTLAAYEPRGSALLGLGALLAWPTIVNATSSSTVGDYIGTAVTVGVAWISGRAIRAWRMLAGELERKAERIDAERESRARLAVADERTRIARELHTVVASSVSAMVVQAEAAQLLLNEDLERADEVMAAVEDTGREALAEMRRILGVLRHSDDGPDLAPQPGVGQVHALVESARGDARRIELSVEGEPGPLPASVDLGVYRILEEALAGSGDDTAQLVGVSAPLRRGRGGARGVDVGREAGRSVADAGDERARGDVRRRDPRRAGRRRRPAPRGDAPAGVRGGVRMTVRVLVADDQELVRTGFRMILDAEPDIEVVGEATNGLEAVAMARELRPDVVLMDIRMPELDGIEATRGGRRRTAGTWCRRGC